jgi:protein involved in polysaccharide export with SLBB domain
MKKVLSLTAGALLLSSQLFAAQAQNKEVRAAATPDKINNIAPRAETPKPHNKKVAKPSEKKPATQASEKIPTEQAPSSATAAAMESTDSATSDTTASAPNPVTGTPNSASPSSTKTPAINSGETGAGEPAAVALTDVYRLGGGDVLDIRLLNSAARESTLYTVLEGGLLEYPLAGDALEVAGLTTDEVDARLTERIKIYEKPQVVVSVREYASHRVAVSGLVNNAGSIALRREAMPLYVVLADAQPQPEAARATIMRGGNQTVTVDLADPKATSTLVLPGDVITLTKLPTVPTQYFFIGGQVASPGQKDFHTGMTLTQAVLASGGATRSGIEKVKVSRQGADGLLVSAEYNLKKIVEGKIPDPLLQPGDRVEVGRGNW